MPNLNSLCNLINDAIKGGSFNLERFNGAVYYGVADPVKSIKEDHESMKPGIIDDEGNVVLIAPDDASPFVIYHKIDRLQYAPDTYGKPGDFMQETADMRLVFIGDRKKIELPVEEVIAFVQLDMPKEFQYNDYKSLNLTSATISIEDTEPDMYKVWEKEFQGIEDRLKPYHLVFTISYRIVSTFNKKCYKIC